MESKGFVSFSNEEIEKMEFYAADLANKKGYFRVLHKYKDGTKEICRVKSGEDSDGLKIWTIGGYTTKRGSTYIAVVAGKVLPGVEIVFHGRRKKLPR